MANQEGCDANVYIKKAWAIRDAAPLSLSIDNFIDAHRGDAAMEKCGKLAIALTILDSERNSKLYTDPSHQMKLDLSEIIATWYPKLFQLLSEGLDLSSIERIFENVTLVIFNYDRCVEHFLLQALRTYYVLEESRAKEIMRRLCVIHPYGMVGYLPWQDRSGLMFGCGADHQMLLEISDQLRTFTEQFADHEARNMMTEAIDNADNIVFLGFAFHEQNMALLKASPSRSSRKVFATAYGVSASDCEAIAADICSIYNSNRDQIRLEIRNDLKCVGLFEQYWRSLRA